METSIILSVVLINLVVLAFLFWWLIKTFASMSEKEKGIYERAVKISFKCPYDLESCDYVDTADCTIGIQCQDCKRYDKGIRPSKI